MSRKTSLAVISAGAAIGLLAAAWAPAPLQPATEAGPGPSGSGLLGAAEQPAGAATTTAIEDATDNSPEAAFIHEMRARFGPHLHRPHAQIRSLEQLIAFLQQRYPDDWQTRIQDFLQRLFPQRAAELYARFKSLMLYHDWLRNNRDRLRGLPAGERQAELWRARHNAFGADAEAIWAAERRSQRLAEALYNLDTQQAPSRQLDNWLGAMHKIYGPKAERLLQQHRTELLGRFLERDSVQRQLAGQTPDSRRSTLRELRQALGMDAAALQRWEALDQRRDQLWSKGQIYMAEREQVLQRYSGTEAQWRLRDLRERHFDPQLAQVIAQEESSGFLRFDGERDYGRE